MAARLCAERPGPDDLVALRRLAEDLDYTILSSEVRVFLRHNAAFHGKIIACARNPELAELVSRLSIPLMRFQFLAFVDRGFIRRSQEDHLAIT